MAKAYLIKELLVKAPNKVGMLADVAAAVSKSGANITAINAFGVDSSAIFRIVTSDNEKAMSELKAKKFEVFEKDAVRLELENKVGMCADMAKKIKDADINIKYIYATACDCERRPYLIFSCNDDKKVIEVLNK